jgi:hypothetical protein
MRASVFYICKSNYASRNNGISIFLNFLETLAEEGTIHQKHFLKDSKNYSMECYYPKLGYKIKQETKLLWQQDRQNN